MEKNITFVVDSGSDFEHYLAAYFNYPVKVVPLNLYINGKEYLDGIDISKATFYKEISTYKELPKTSQPTPQKFYEVFQKEIEKRNQVLYVGISSKLSGTFQSATIAKTLFSEEEQKRIYLFDSLSVSATVIFHLFKANDLLNSGASLDKVVSNLEEYRSRVKLIAFLDTLENLKKGGRVSSAQAALGGLLSIKPMIAIEDGLVESLDKFRGRKKGLKYIADFINNPENKIAKNKVFFVHSYTDEDRLKEEYKELGLSEFKEVIHLKLGTTVGTHAGANTVGLVYENDK